MEEWLRIGIYQVNELLKLDPGHRKLQSDLLRTQEKYLRIIQKLDPQDRECVEHYVALCEDLEYQRTYTAYYCGKMRG